MIGFIIMAVLMTALVGAGPAAAQCGPGTNSNTACGTDALSHDTTGEANSAFGFEALDANTTGEFNTSSGFEALGSNQEGSDNTASGARALVNNTTGNDNTASGAFALFISSGSDNTASGAFALDNNTAGNDNTATGFDALFKNTTGDFNTASGLEALFSNTTGRNNIALGADAGANLTTGNNNIDIGDEGVAGDADTIRIGTKGTQTKTFIAGISGTTVSGADVIVSSTGQLGVATSSARYKHDIRDMGNASAGLMKLRPVSFRYNNDPSETVQYGLVAEEVARVYPELVTYGTDGKVQSVRYLEVTALLLNELQKQNHELQTQVSRTRELAQRLESKDRQLADQQREIDALTQQNAAVSALSERVAVLERQAQKAIIGRPSLASK